MAKKNVLNSYQQQKGKTPLFIIERDGKAYFKDKRFVLICKPTKLQKEPKYPNYFYEFDYMEKLDWFKRIITLLVVNNGQVKFIGMSLDEFNNLNGTPITIENANLVKIKNKKLR